MDKKRWIILAAVFLTGLASLIFDKALAVFFKSLQNSVLTPILSLFEPTLFILIFAVIMIAASLKENKKNYALAIIYALIISGLISYGLKFIFMRARPFDFIEYLPFTNLIDYSFPSSHCVAIFALLPVLWKEFKRLRYVWLFVAVIVALTRLYFGVHYLSDVILGSVIGYLIGILVRDTVKDKRD